MKKIAFLLLLPLIFYPSNASMHSSTGGGLSVLIGRKAHTWYPGFNLEFIMLAKPVKYVGIGGGLLYMWLGANLPDELSDEYRVTFHCWRLPVILRGAYPVSEKAHIFVDYGNGLTIGMQSYHVKNSRDYKSSAVDFGLFAGGGAVIKNFEFKMMFNFVNVAGVIEDLKNHRVYEPVRWLSFNIGFYY